MIRFWIVLIVSSACTNVRIDSLELSQGPFYNTRSAMIKSNECFYSAEKVGHNIVDSGFFKGYFRASVTLNQFQELCNFIHHSIPAEVFEERERTYFAHPSQSEYSLKITYDGGEEKRLIGNNFPPEVFCALDSLFSFVENRNNKEFVNRLRRYSTLNDVYIEPKRKEPLPH